MTNSLAIAAVTSTLQSILQHGVVTETDLNDTTVTILPLDKARSPSNSHNQVNLFLYQVSRNAAWSNRDMPLQVKPGELGIPPLPLNLYYLVTAFGRDDDATQPFGHQLLGKAMSLLHDHPALSADDIKAATQATLPDSDLDRQLERVRITLHPLNLDELSKLWTGFAMQYRLSAAYEVAVALIESTRAASAPLPVLTRGASDGGIASQPDLTPPLPTLTDLTAPHHQPSALLNDSLTVTGFHLDGTNVGVDFMHPLWSAPVEVAPATGGTAQQIAVTIPPQPSDWPPGFYGVTVLVQRTGEPFRRTTNQLPLALAPAITIAPKTVSPGTIIFTVTTSPKVWPGQRVVLLLGDQEIPTAALAAKADTLNFSANLAAGTYYARLRVDGVDSQLVNRNVAPPAFDANVKVVVS
jgi:Pvc16 N-terminal domain